MYRRNHLQGSRESRPGVTEKADFKGLVCLNSITKDFKSTWKPSWQHSRGLRTNKAPDLINGGKGRAWSQVKSDKNKRLVTLPKINVLYTFFSTRHMHSLTTPTSFSAQSRVPSWYAISSGYFRCPMFWWPHLSWLSCAQAHLTRPCLLEVHLQPHQISWNSIQCMFENITGCERISSSPKVWGCVSVRTAQKVIRGTILFAWDFYRRVDRMTFTLK